MTDDARDELPNHAIAVDDPPGIEVDRVTSWLAERIDWLAAPLTWERLPGGHSNFTYRVIDANGRAFVLRRPPLGELLPSAHDMGREYRIIEALWSTAVPVPEPLAHCTDVDVTGAPFYAMGQVRGRSLYLRSDVEELVPEANRHPLGVSFIDVLTDLHAIDPDEVGLGRLGKPEAYVTRQLNRWYASWNASKTAERPEVDALVEFLLARVPEQGRARVVHGDYGLHNCISTPEGYVAAVVDWEISTLGDPMADLAYALNGWIEPGDADPARPEAPVLAPGFPRRAELLARYAERTGADVSQIDFYSAFNHWKTVCIIEGVYARYLKGQKSTVGVDLDGLCHSRDRSLSLAVERAGAFGFVAP